MSAIRAVAVCLVLPTAANVFLYYGYTTQYTEMVFSPAGFKSQYDSGVYRYRLLGQLLFLRAWPIVDRIYPSPMPETKQEIHARLKEYRLMRFLETESLGLYHTYFVINTLFLCLTMWRLRAITRLPPVRMTEQIRTPWLLTVLFFICLSQFVVVPYDMISLFLMAVCMDLMLRDEGPWTLPVLAGLTIIAAMTRETAALILSFYATLWVMRRELRTPRTLAGLGLLVAAFVGAYVMLRVMVGWDQAAFNELIPPDTLRPGSIVSILFFLAAMVVLVDWARRPAVKATGVFLAFSCPYIAAILLTGILFEIRLWIPVLLGAAVLNRLAYDAAPGMDADG